MIDLHIHTTSSDGSDEPKDILLKAQKAGDTAFLAHLYVYFADDHEELLNSMVSLNALDGIECYHSFHTID